MKTARTQCRCYRNTSMLYCVLFIGEIMKIQALINELENIKKIRGSDIEVVLSVDPEGNSFSTLEPQSISYVFQGEDKFVDAQAAGCLSGEAKKIIDDFYNQAKVVGICLFPWEEGFNTAEDACNWFKKKEEEELTHKIAQAENQLDTMKEEGRL